VATIDVENGRMKKKKWERERENGELGADGWTDGWMETREKREERRARKNLII
jgi:hypothetical protein